MLRLADRWVWDSWHADDGVDHHLFFLCAPRALGDPDRRHDHAAVGHATSRDLTHWPSSTPTRRPGTTAQCGPDRWCAIPADPGACSTPGSATPSRGSSSASGRRSPTTSRPWTRVGDGPLLEADPRWYGPRDPDEAWRDPYVFPDPDGDGWHMLITARVGEGGVIGHARSPDLVAWEVVPPLTAPARFTQLEVPQSVTIDGHQFLVFSCWADGGGVWIAPGESLLGPWDIEGAVALDHPSLYAGRLVHDQVGDWFVIGFRDIEHGAFVGEITDPLRIERHGRTVRLRM